MTSKFMKGYIVGVVTGVVFRDPIVRNLRKLADAANAKAEEMDEKVEKVEKEPEAEAASALYPANGVNLSAGRKREINISTPDAPIVLTLEDIQAMNVEHVKFNLESGRFQLPESMKP